MIIDIIRKRIIMSLQDSFDAGDRLRYYRENPLNLDSKNESFGIIREIFYLNNFIKKEDLENIKNDSNHNIRQKYYELNPNDRDSKFDTHPYIRPMYYRQFTNDNNSKFDISNEIRNIYYQSKPYDKNAKYETFYAARFSYYKFYIFDLDGIKDSNFNIRKFCKKNKEYLERIIKRKVTDNKFTHVEKTIIINHLKSLFLNILFTGH
jgi:hypothetical protein